MTDEHTAGRARGGWRYIPSARTKSSVRSVYSRLLGGKRNWLESIGPRKLTSVNLRLKRHRGGPLPRLRS